MGKEHNYKKKVVRKPEPKPKKNKRGTNYLEKEARYLTRNYTNKLIRQQIENDNFCFFLYILLLVVAAVLIFAVGGEGGLVFGCTIVVVVFILMIISGTFNMPKHIRPACSGRRYTPREIDAMANDPDTTWNEIIRAFVTPTTLIGINKGITVVDYEDIESVYSRKRWHSERATTINSDARRFGRLYNHYGDHLRYRNRLEWYTYVIRIKTHSGKRLTLTETVYEDACEALNAIVAEKRGEYGSHT
ncbi:MAG: hypothetical protein J6U23_11410 [Clostridiales bacterium]|nr:hypothetical protein [Clostridiales bacterium]